MNLRSGLVSMCAVALAAVVGGCSGGGGDTGEAGQPSSNDGTQEEVCAPDFSAMTAQPFSANMPAMGNGYSATLTSDPPVPTLGDHSTFTLTIKDSTGAPLPAGTKIAAECLMSHASGFSHGCPANIAVTGSGDGVFTAKPVIFNMQGHWLFMLHVTPEGGATKDVDYDFCLQ